MKKNLSIALFLVAGFCFSQEKILYKNAAEIIQQANAAGEEGDFAKALELVNSLSSNDANSCDALISKSYFLLNLDRNDEAIAMADKGLENDCTDSDLSFYINKGVALDEKNSFPEALEVYDLALLRYPKNAQLWYNKGVVLEQDNKIPEAVHAYQRAIIYKPTYKNAHLKLGTIAYKQDLMAQALMSFNMFLLLDPDTEEAFTILNALNTAVAEKNPHTPDSDLVISPDDETFETIDLVLSNKFALNKDYVIDNKIVLPITKQNHALLDQLKDYDGTEGFWAKTYVPFYQWVVQEGLFDNFIYTLLYSVQNEDYKKIVEKNKDGVLAFVNAQNLKWHEIIQNSNIAFEEEEKSMDFKFDSNYLEGIGKLEGDIPQGKWTFYNAAGEMTGEGEFNNTGDRHGKWTWFYPKGNLKESAVYKDGNLEGENFSFFEDGKKELIAAYLNNELEGEFKLYNEKGALIEKKYFKNGKLHGDYVSYFSIGEVLPEFEVLYENGLVKGSVKEYYSNGDLYSEMDYKGELKHGPEKQYYTGGDLFFDVAYVDGAPNGKRQLFFPNGKLMENSQYLNGEIEGNAEFFYPDGTLKAKANYEKGKMDGPYAFYDKDGKLYFENTFRKGELIGYKYFSKTGDVIQEATKKSTSLDFKGYSPHGKLTAQGLYDIKGGKTGFWKFYNNHGDLSEQGNYTDGLAQGEYFIFHPNGRNKINSFYRNDSLDGYYTEFHFNGKMKNQGWYKDDLQEGEWRTYNIDGSLYNISYLDEGQMHGKQEIFNGAGKLVRTVVFNENNAIRETFYTPEGEFFEEIEYNSSEDTYVVKEHHFNGKLKSSTEYRHGIKHGRFELFDFYGTKRISGNYLNGIEHGTWTRFYDNGNKEEVKNFVLGELDRELVEYYADGQVEQTGQYKKDLVSGTWTSYHENGKVNVISENKDGEDHGRREFYSPSGKLQLIRFYEFDRLVGYSYLDKNGVELPMIPLQDETGKVVAYYDNGKVSREMDFVKGKISGVYKAYYYSGELENEIAYEDGYYNGKYSEFYEDGTPKLVQEYLYDHLNGMEVRYFSNGQKKSEIPYANHVKEGESLIYNEAGKLIKKEKYFHGNIYSSESF